jgi:predicted nucleic acid-binding protein
LIYVDASVVLAWIFGEEQRPSREFWDGPRFASRLTELEVRVRAGAKQLSANGTAGIDAITSRLRFTEISPETVGLLYSDAPKNLRTLDAIHLATLEYLRRTGRELTLATYDRRLAAAAEAMGFQVIVP